ncbi:MAG: hypothetical protein QOG74_2558 [Alphaproteobacteria bacterium]|jgi:hypothetical protein|nr:hypothetical protein [Alphaproteobacteria bacterium]
MTAQAQRLAPDTARKLAVGLGWFSVALGVSELFGSRRMARWLGMDDRESLLRAYGLREIATGVGILASRRPAPWLWARVAGDGLDMATLRSAATRAGHPQRQNAELAAAAVVGVTALDILAARALSQPQAERPQVTYDYSSRSGFPQSPERMRGAARDFVVPEDFRTPELLRPFL